MIVNPHLDEIALSDYVASELGIILLDLEEGLTLFKTIGTSCKAGIPKPL